MTLPGLTELQLSDRYFSHERLAQLNLQYLIHDDFRQEKNSTREEFVAKKEKYALLEYAGSAWGWHANCCRPLPESILRLCNELLDLLNAKWISYSEVAGGRANGSYAQFIERFRDSYPSPLFYASLWGIVETMQFLIDERHEDVNHVGRLYGSPLKAAAAHGHEDAVILLSARGANIDLNSGQFSTAIQPTATQGKVKIVEILLQHKPHINLKSGWWEETPLTAASKWSNRKVSEAIVKQLIIAGADVNAIDQRGETAMHKFAENGVTSILKLLVSYNANIYCINMTGNTPLMLAIKEDRESAVDFLIRGTEINISNRDGESALHISAELYQPTTTSLLLEHGADVNAQSLIIAGSGCGQPDSEQIQRQEG